MMCSHVFGIVNLLVINLFKIKFAIEVLYILLKIYCFGIINENFTQFSFSHWKYLVHQINQGGPWFKTSSINIVLEIFRVKNTFVIDAYRYNFDIIFQLIQIFKCFKQMLYNIIWLLRKTILSISRSYIILKNCCNRIIFNNFLYQLLVDVININIILIKSFNQKMTWAFEDFFN